MDEEIVPFGKHKGKPVSVLLADQNYLKWCKDNKIFEKYTNTNLYNIVYNINVLPISQDAPTPEHNKLQNLFLDKNIQYAFVNSIYNIDKKLEYFKKSIFIDNYLKSEDNLSEWVQTKIRSSLQVKFEEKFNWDIVLTIGYTSTYNNSKYITTYMDKCNIFRSIIAEKLTEIFKDKIAYELYISGIYKKVVELYTKCSVTTYKDYNKVVYCIPQKCKEDTYFNDKEYDEFAEKYIKNVTYDDKKYDDKFRNHIKRIKNGHLSLYEIETPKIELTKEELNTSIETIFLMQDIKEFLLHIDRKDFWKKEIKEKIDTFIHRYGSNPIGQTIENIGNSLKEPLKDITNHTYRNKYDDIYKDIYGHDITIYTQFTDVCSICCELKPLLGDDYPCVLRKMKQQIDSTKRHIKEYCYDNNSPFKEKVKFVLIVKEFKSDVTSLKQVQTIFAQHSIKLILLDSFIQDTTIIDKEFIVNKIQELEKELQMYKDKLSLIITV